MKIFKTLLFAVLLAVAPIYGQDASKALKVGDKAPQFTLYPTEKWECGANLVSRRLVSVL